MTTTASPAARLVATNARQRFYPMKFAGAAEESATSMFRLCTLVRLGKADPSIAADLMRRTAHDGNDWMPFELWHGLLRTADELAGAR